MAEPHAKAEVSLTPPHPEHWINTAELMCSPSAENPALTLPAHREALLDLIGSGRHLWNGTEADSYVEHLRREPVE